MAEDAGADFQRLAKGLKSADRPIRLAVRKGLRKVAQPLGKEMLQNGAAHLPKGGGLSARVRKTTVSLGMLGGARGAGGRVEIRLKSRDGYDLKAMNDGRVRHPTFGRKPWVLQRVPQDRFMEPFHKSGPAVRDELALQIRSALDQIAGD